MIKLMASVPPLETPTGVEVGEHLLAPGLQCSAEPSDLGDRTGREAGDHLLSDPATLGGAAVVDGAELLVALPGQVRLRRRGRRPRSTG